MDNRKLYVTGCGSRAITQISQVHGAHSADHFLGLDEFTAISAHHYTAIIRAAC